MTRHAPEAERRAQILRAARATFLEHGYMAARVVDVAKRARLSKGAVYFYFRSKRELFDALVQEEHARTLSFLAEAADDPRPVADKIVELGARYLLHFGTMKAPPRFFLLMSEMATRDDGIRDTVSAIHHRFIALLARILLQGMDEGTFRQVDPIAAAVVIKAFIDGVAGQAAVGIPLDISRLSTDGIRVLLEGLALPGHALSIPVQASGSPEVQSPPIAEANQRE